MSRMSVADAAVHLNISPSRVRTLVREGSLCGSRSSGVLMVDTASVLQRASRNLSKPLDSVSSWEAANAMEGNIQGATSSKRHRLRKRLTDKSADNILRSLSRRHSTSDKYIADPDDVMSVLNHENTVPTGSSVYDPSSRVAQVYTTDKESLLRDHTLVPSSTGNLTIYTAPVTPHDLATGVPEMIVSADAAESASPSARARGRAELVQLSKNPKWKGKAYPTSRYNEATPDGEVYTHYHDPFLSAIPADKATSLWAKTDYWDDDSSKWGLLITHLSDAGRVSAKIWDTWLSDNTKRSISEGTGLGETLSKKLLVFLAATHDIGKASPAFQVQAASYDRFKHLLTRVSDAGLPLTGEFKSNIQSSMPRHEEVSMFAVSRAVPNEGNRPGIFHSKFTSAVVGAHHGYFPERRNMVNGVPALGGGYSRSSDVETPWTEVQDGLVVAAKELAGITPSDWDALCGADIHSHAITLLSGIVVMADWISSNSDYFPLGHPSPPLPSPDRTEKAWKELNLNKNKWVPSDVGVHNLNVVFGDRFPGIGSPRPAQEAAVSVAERFDAPGLIVLEAPTGCGKTEAALLSAEVLAHKFGCDGVLFALPTRATSNAAYVRVNKWLETQNPNLSAHLTHGKAEFNKEFQSRLDRFSKGSQSSVHDEDGHTDCCGELHTWFDSSRNKHLADFTVGTVDQVLLASAAGKHLSVRHLGLSGKVVVLDEVHASDVYMAAFLVRTLRWLGRMGVPVVALTATLTPSLRRALHNAYSGSSQEYMPDSRRESTMGFKEAEEVDHYPVITSSFPGAEKVSVESFSHHLTRTVSVEKTNTVSVRDTVAKMLPKINESGCAALIFNTVSRAQEAFEILQNELPDTCELIMVHSRFTGVDRARIENKVLSLTGKDGARPKHLVVVSTQVIEQSLDVDFDIMYSDIAPLDLIVQRMGRLHRHIDRANRDPKFSEPRIIIGGYRSVDGEPVQLERRFTMWVYEEILLMRTAHLLDGLETITEPQDLPGLMKQLDRGVDVPDSWRERYATALERSVSDANKVNTLMPKRTISVPKDDGVPWRNSTVDKNSFTPVRRGTPNVDVVLVFETENGLVLPMDGEHGQGWHVTGNVYKDLVKAIALRAVPLDGQASRSVRGTGYGSSKRARNVPAAVLCADVVPNWERSKALRGLGLLILTPDDSSLTCGSGVIEGVSEYRDERTGKVTKKPFSHKILYDPVNGLRRDS